MSHTWILIGDGSHARIFQSDDPAHPWRLVQTLDREHSREKTSESHEDGGEHGFARHLVGQLEKGRQAGTFGRLVLVAPPKFLGQLRSELAAPLAGCVMNSIDADYTKMAAGELPKHVTLE